MIGEPEHDDSRVTSGRVRADVGEPSVEGYKQSVLVANMLGDTFVRGPGQPLLGQRMGVVPVVSEESDQA